MMGLPFASVVICTYNRKIFLKDCLNSIFRMEYPESLYEVIVIDGGSNDGTEDLCKEFPRIIFRVEKKLGLPSARNKGAEFAHGSIVAYTDDDCIVDKKWLTNICLGFNMSSSIVGVGGPVYLLHPEDFPKKILVEAALGIFEEGKNIKLITGLITANSAFRKELFKQIQFNEKLGKTRKGRLIKSDEDTVLCNDIIEHGLQLLYMPDAVVFHQTIRERLRVIYIIKHAIHSGINKSQIILRRTSRLYAIRICMTGLGKQLLKICFDFSLVSCYNVIYQFTMLFVCVSHIDKTIF